MDNIFIVHEYPYNTFKPMFKPLTITELEKKAFEIRRDVLVTVTQASSGHPGGPLSMADYLTALWFRYLRINPEEPNWSKRDRFILSNGHASALLYTLMSHRGFFPRKELLTFRNTHSRLVGHPSSIMLPGVEISTGSLGQGLSVAQGMALGLRMQNNTDSTVYCNCGDGELQEGSIWETVMSAGHYKVDNLVLSVDANDAQIDGRVNDVMSVEPLNDKFEAFNWRVMDCDGHDLKNICKAWEDAENRTGKPTVILFRTVMMKGCKTYEDIPGWHGRPPTQEECDIMLRELGFETDFKEIVNSMREL